MYLQRYVPHLPAAGEVVIFDRSCTTEQALNGSWVFAARRGQAVPGGRSHRRTGIRRIRCRAAEILAGGQSRRADEATEDRIDDGRKIWKLSPMDLESYGHWYDYSRGRERCLCHRHRMGCLVCGELGRQEAHASEHHSAIAQQNPLRSDQARPRQASQAIGKKRLRRPIVARDKEIWSRVGRNRPFVCGLAQSFRFNLFREVLCVWYERLVVKEIEDDDGKRPYGHRFVLKRADEWAGLVSYLFSH